MAETNVVPLRVAAEALRGLVRAARLSHMSVDGRSVECELAEQIAAAETAIAAVDAALAYALRQGRSERSRPLLASH